MSTFISQNLKIQWKTRRPSSPKIRTKLNSHKATRSVLDTLSHSLAKRTRFTFWDLDPLKMDQISATRYKGPFAISAGSREVGKCSEDVPGKVRFSESRTHCALARAGPSRAPRVPVGTLGTLGTLGLGNERILGGLGRFPGVRFGARGYRVYVQGSGLGSGLGFL